MSTYSRLIPTLLPLLLAACASSPAPEPMAVAEPQPVAVSPQEGQLWFNLASGDYRCDLGATVRVVRHVDNANRLDLAWKGRQFAMLRDPSYSGLPRFEEAQARLVWIDLPWKSVLLDSRTGKPLANECRPIKG